MSLSTVEAEEGGEPVVDAPPHVPARMTAVQSWPCCAAAAVAGLGRVTVKDMAWEDISLDGSHTSTVDFRPRITPPEYVLASLLSELG